MDIVFNIGLENNPYQFNTSEIQKLVFVATGGVLTGERREMGEYLGSEERTLVMKFDLPENLPLAWITNMDLALSRVSSLLNQDCIAYYIDGWMEEGLGRLVYSTHYEGERIVFDEKYFINF